MDSPDFARTIAVAVRGLTAVSDMSDIRSVPSVAAGNAASHAIGLGQMNLHGYLARKVSPTVARKGWTLPTSILYRHGTRCIRRCR